MDIPLRNRKGEVIDYTIVSPEHYEHLNQFKWCKSDGYVQGIVNNKNWRLHRYIKLEILKENIPKGHVVDHIDNNPLNNQKDNLRITTISENNYNKKKRNNCSSEYMGVTKRQNKFESRININNKSLSAKYNDEIHAAHQYNLWVDEYNLITATKNAIEIPKNFVQHISKNSLKEIPKRIQYTKDKTKFKVKIYIDKKPKYLGTFDTLEEANTVRNNAEKQRDETYKQRLLSLPKTFNEKNQCVVKIKDTEIIIDEDLFHNIIQYKWWIDNGYVRGILNGKQIGLSRYVMNYSGEDYIDHINNNKLDNRKINLQIATPLQNAQNKLSRKGSSSKYLGVSWVKRDKKWRSMITVKGKGIHLGTFTDEIDAAKARDIATLKYFGSRGNLNFPQEISE